jgi:hypothetical protein
MSANMKISQKSTSVHQMYGKSEPKVGNTGIILLKTEEIL